MEPTVRKNLYPARLGPGGDTWNIQSSVNPNWWETASSSYSGLSQWVCMHGFTKGECPGADDDFCGDGPDDDRFVHVEPEEVDAAVSGLLRLLK